MHRTRTVDCAIVLGGEIDMLLDDPEIHLEAGDVLIQQGTNHAWLNRGKEPCQLPSRPHRCGRALMTEAPRCKLHRACNKTPQPLTTAWEIA